MFPKQYPQWRPPPQWSRTIGLTHNGSVHLFKEGQVVGEEFRHFVEEGDSLQLELMLSESRMVELGKDTVNILPVPTGVGSRQSTIFIEGSNNKVKGK